MHMSHIDICLIHRQPWVTYFNFKNKKNANFEKKSLFVPISDIFKFSKNVFKH